MAERSASGRRPNVYTVPPCRAFLDGLAAAILSGNLPAVGGPPPADLDLPAMTLYLPTRRATRALQEAFLAAAAGRAMLLPRIVPISEGEEDLAMLLGAGGVASLSGIADGIPPEIGGMARLLTLTRLVGQWSEAMRSHGSLRDGALGRFAAAGANTPAQAAALAADLARLMDMVETEGVSLAGLEALVEPGFAEHWQQTLEFLKIITEFWPAHLAAHHLISPADRRNRLIEAEALRLESAPPEGPVIVAGVTGSVPATQKLMRAVAALPMGAIVLPGLDQMLDAESWAAISGASGTSPHPEHPQFGLKKLIDALGLSRDDIAVLPGTTLEGANAARARLVSEALRPAGTTERWQSYAAELGSQGHGGALDGMSLIEAPSPQDEAEAIALILRQAAEIPGRTAALVSPDRLLARRVAIRLETWGIRVDDSAGRPFAKTVPGAFLDLVIEAAASDFAPTSVVALLKHPLARLGLDAFSARRAARALEIAAFRTDYLSSGLSGVEHALERAARDVQARRRRDRAVQRLWDDDWDQARELLARLAAAYTPLMALYASPDEQPLAAFAEAHVRTAEALSRLPETAAEDTSLPLWQGEAGLAAQLFFNSLADPGLVELPIRRADYADLYRSLVSGLNVRPRVPVHPRLFIWGPFESRLQQPDVVVLGSLNDGTWPEAADPGPWLNRPMRAALGLPSPEERIGYEAHDFAMLLGAREVILTRATKKDGVPAVPSRWLMRLRALLDGAGLAPALQPSSPWLGWARARDTASPMPAITAPRPTPPLEARPRKLSVSRVETWIANPYAIFAREILGLEPMPALGKAPDAALKGSIIHEALSRFTAAHPESLPEDPARVLVALAAGILEEYAAHPRVAAFWVPRMTRFADWFGATERERRRSVARVVAETAGRLVIAAPSGPFELTARADRIDIGEAGLVITDYKTGVVPKAKRVAAGLSPQLPLEAAIAMARIADSGFAHVPPSQVAGLRYIRATGGEPPGEETAVATADVNEIATRALLGLSTLAARFDDPATPYAAVRRQQFSYDFDDYAHLSRLAEWSAGLEGEEAAE